MTSAPNGVLVFSRMIYIHYYEDNQPRKDYSMNDNEKTAIVVLAAFTAWQSWKFRKFRKNVADFAAATDRWVQLQYQEKVDTEFSNIVKNYGRY